MLRCKGGSCDITISGGSSIGGASAPPLLKFGDEKKRRRRKEKNPVKKHYMPNHLNSKYTVLTRLMCVGDRKPLSTTT